METSRTNEASVGIKPGAEIILGSVSLVGSGILEVVNRSAESTNIGISEFTLAGILAGFAAIYHGVRRALS